MTRMRLLRLDGDAKRRGEDHAAAYRAEIRRYTEERVRLASNGSWAGRPATREDVLSLAESTIPAHRAYDADLTDEMEAMARAAGLSLAELVIVGGFTDFVDLVRARAGAAAEEDDCTAALVPDALAGGHGFLAQTWDMHDSATEHVVLFDLHPDGAPAALVFSTVGCLGQIGMNEAGIAIGINNLTAARGAAGVTWPHVVRKALKQTALDAALRCVTDASLCGAHNYLLIDASGRGVNVEAMPGGCHVEELGAEPLVHTNHCLHPDTKRLEARKAEPLLQSSVRRLERARELLAAPGPITAQRLIDFTRDAGICQRAEPPFEIESSGAAILRPATREFHAVWGIPADNEYERLVVGST
jgi:isopenicillin-N N-acyltransferase-like protein